MYTKTVQVQSHASFVLFHKPSTHRSNPPVSKQILTHVNVNEHLVLVVVWLHRYRDLEGTVRLRHFTSHNNIGPEAVLDAHVRAAAGAGTMRMHRAARPMRRRRDCATTRPVLPPR